MTKITRKDTANPATCVYCGKKDAVVVDPFAEGTILRCRSCGREFNGYDLPMKEWGSITFEPDTDKKKMRRATLRIPREKLAAVLGLVEDGIGILAVQHNYERDTIDFLLVGMELMDVEEGVESPELELREYNPASLDIVVKHGKRENMAIDTEGLAKFAEREND